jgi:hypothetical protein
LFTLDDDPKKTDQINLQKSQLWKAVYCCGGQKAAPNRKDFFEVDVSPFLTPAVLATEPSEMSVVIANPANNSTFTGDGFSQEYNTECNRLWPLPSVSTRS